MSNLYEISKELEILIKTIELAEGEIVPEVERALARLDSQVNGKIRALRGVIRNEETRLAGIKEEMERLKNLKKSSENKIEWIKNYLVACVAALGGKFDGGTFKLSVGETSAVEANLDEIPELYKRVKTIVEVDKESIREHLKVPGTIIPGASLVVKQFLRMS